MDNCNGNGNGNGMENKENIVSKYTNPLYNDIFT